MSRTAFLDGGGTDEKCRNVLFFLFHLWYKKTVCNSLGARVIHARKKHGLVKAGGKGCGIRMVFRRGYRMIPLPRRMPSRP